MPPEPSRCFVAVTRHARRRWVERAPAYFEGLPPPVASAFRGARRLSRADAKCLTFRQRPKTLCFAVMHSPLVFIAVQDGARTLRIVTVIDVSKRGPAHDAE